MRAAPGASAEEPEMRPLAPPPEPSAPATGEKMPKDEKDELPPASELPQLPFGNEGKG